MKHTEASIQLKLWQELEMGRGHRPVAPNVFMPNWYECDCVSVTKANSWNEFEIKISRADFRNDAKKEGRLSARAPVTKKHDALHAAHDSGPSRFIYVTPPGLLTPTDIPAFAGLWEVGHGYRIREIVAAPKLHNGKLTTEEISKLYEAMYWRYWSFRKKHTMALPKLDNVAAVLVALKEADVSKGALDEAVRYAHAESSTTVNNGGVAEQVEYLLSHGWRGDDIVCAAKRASEEDA